MITLNPVGYVTSPRNDTSDDNWGAIEAKIELCPDFNPEALDGLEEFSHVEVIFSATAFPKTGLNAAHAIHVAIQRGRKLVFLRNAVRTVRIGWECQWPGWYDARDANSFCKAWMPLTALQCLISNQ